MTHDYQALERELRSLVADVGSALEASELRELEMYLNAGEYGLAFETLCACVRRRKPTLLPPKAFGAIAELGQRMSIEAEHWEDLGET